MNMKSKIGRSNKQIVKINFKCHPFTPTWFIIQTSEAVYPFEMSHKDVSFQPLWKQLPTPTLRNPQGQSFLLIKQ